MQEAFLEGDRHTEGLRKQSPPARIRLWDDLRGFEDGYRVTSEVAPSGVTHLTLAR